MLRIGLGIVLSFQRFSILFQASSETEAFLRKLEAPLKYSIYKEQSQRLISKKSRVLPLRADQKNFALLCSDRLMEGAQLI